MATRFSFHGPPTGKTPVDGATRQVDHQYFSYNAATDTFGPGSQGSFIPQKFYELEMREDFAQLHPDLPAKTRFFGFHDNNGNLRVPGPLIRRSTASRCWSATRTSCRP